MLICCGVGLGCFGLLVLRIDGFGVVWDCDFGLFGFGVVCVVWG